MRPEGVEITGTGMHETHGYSMRVYHNASTTPWYMFLVFREEEILFRGWLEPGQTRGIRYPPDTVFMESNEHRYSGIMSNALVMAWNLANALDEA